MNEKGGNLLIKVILKLIMSTGTAFILVLASGLLLCPIQVPISTNMCVLMTNDIISAVKAAGIVPQAIGTVGGIAVYWMSGKGTYN